MFSTICNGITFRIIRQDIMSRELNASSLSKIGTYSLAQAASIFIASDNNDEYVYIIQTDDDNQILSNFQCILDSIKNFDNNF